jgi:hypothetical protein
MHTYRLRGASGKVANKVFGLTGKTVVGRSSECDLIVDDESIAPRHAEILLSATGEMQLRSLDSNFAIHVNGSPVNQVMLSTGDEIRLGNCRWVLQAPGLRPGKVLSGTALEQRRKYWPWLLVVAILAAAVLAWQRGWLGF